MCIHFHVVEVAGTTVSTEESNLLEEDKEKWGKVLVADVMSSEESDSENEEILLVKPLAWHTDRVSQYFQQLHGKMEK